MDYAELVTEAQIRTDIPDVASRAEHYVRSAERALQKALKVGGMEKEATLVTDANGDATLPDDYLKMRTGSPVEISGNTLHTGVRSGTVAIAYYAALPSVVDNGTNWLLEEEPELYITALMVQIYAAKGEYDKATMAGQYLSVQVKAVMDADILARFAQRNMNMAGVGL